MKNSLFWLCIGSASMISACVSHYAPLQPVGPDPVASGDSVPGPGVLVVYSAWSSSDNYDTTDHSGYNVYSNDGRLVEWVPNYIEGHGSAEPPTRVPLPDGSYKIRAKGGRYGWVTVPVVIKYGLTTPVYLDGRQYSMDSLITQNNAVKLPDGEIVGWAANPAPR